MERKNRISKDNADKDYKNEKNEKQAENQTLKTVNLLKSAFKFNNYCLYL